MSEPMGVIRGEPEVRVHELVIAGSSDLPARPDVSVIVPVTERPEPLAELYLEYSRPFADSDLAYEFVFAVEPSNRKLVEPLRELAERGQPIRVLEAGHALGESTLLKLGAARSRADILIILPAYRRVIPEALPELVKAIRRGADLVNCRRWPRNDSWVNRLQTRVLHTLVTGVSTAHIRDVGSGVRAVRRDVLDQIPLYGDFFRFLPVLALRDGYRVTELEARQHERDARTRIYSPGVYVRRLIDVFGLFFLSRFTYKPLRFFGLVGGFLGTVGALILIVLFIQRLAGQALANRPMLLLGVLIFTLGVQAIALGLIGEIIVHFNAPTRRAYRIAADDGVASEARAEDDDGQPRPSDPAGRP